LLKSWFDQAAAAPGRVEHRRDHAAVEIDAVVRQFVSEPQPDDDVVRVITLEHDAEPPHERRFRPAVGQRLPVY
jgi:hypothetical protein